jgi:translocation and assembly module TamB
MHKKLKYIIYFFSGLVLLVFLLLLFTQTSVFRGIVRSQVEKMANEQLDGEVTLGELEGNFFTHLTLKELWLGKTRQDTILAIDRLALSYSLWPLLNGKVQVASIQMDQPYFNLIQRADSTWNFQDILPPPKEKTDTSSAPMKLSFELGVFALNQGYIEVSMLDSLVPRFIKDLNIELSGGYSAKRMEVDLQHLGFATPEGITDLEHFQVWVEQQDSVWTIKDLALVTPRNRVDLSGRYADIDSLSGDLETTPIELEEFAWVLPEFRLGVTPKVDLNASVAGNDLQIDLIVSHEQQQIKLKGTVSDFTGILNDSTRHQSLLNLDFHFQKMNPQQWLLLSDLPLILNGNLHVSGNGLEGSKQPLKVDGDFTGTRWQRYLLGKFGINGSYLDGKTKVHTRFSTDVGTFDLKASANLKNDNAPVSVNLIAERFPADRFLPEWSDSTLLNLELKARGTGNDFKTLNADFSLLMHNSVAARIPVDSMWVSGQLQNESIVLDTLRFLNSSANISARGKYSDDGDITSNFNIVLSDLAAFKPYLELPAQWKLLQLDGEANGRLDSLLVDVIIQSDSLAYDTLATATSLHMVGTGLISPKGFSGESELSVIDLKASGQQADSLRLDADMETDKWDARLALWMPDSVSLQTRVLGNMKMPFVFQIPELNINTSFEQFSLVGEGPEVFVDSARMALDSLQMTAHQNKDFKLYAGGEYIPGDSVAFNALIENLDLSLIGELLKQKLPVSGMVSLDLMANGPLSSPSLDLKLQGDSLEAGELRVKEIDAGISHFADTLRASLMMKSNRDDSIMVNGFSVVNINLTDSQMVSSIKTIDGEIVARKVRPSAFFAFDDTEDQLFKALLDMDVKISGEVVKPVMRGFIRVTNGGVSWPAYGIKYSDLKLVTKLDSNRVVVDSLFVRREKGTLMIKGNMAFDSTFVSGNLSDADMSVKAKDFFVSRHRNHEIQINSDAWVRMKNEVPEFGGTLRVLRSRFYLPALLKMGGSSDINKPMLVRALEQQEADSVLLSKKDTVSVFQRDTLPDNDMMKKLTGTLNVVIPRNTWIKSEDMNLELHGDFDLLKNSTYFEIFGSLGISRGNYTLYGRKLIIQEGQLTFQGGEKINPRINIEASYKFRGKDKQKNELIMKAAGTAFEPDLSFTLNGTNITERDAMAYLIFNQSFDQLSFGNQQGVSGNVPSAMLSGLVSTQLTKTLGSTFDLDMVEVKAGDDWSSATFMVGKYITNNLFVTYQRGFGESEEESLTPQTITLEYEVTRNLFLRLTQGDVKDSGVDVILKFEKQ